MAHAKNMAHRLGILEGGDILVNLDADNFTGPGFAAYVAKKFEEPNIFLWSNMIKEGPDRLPRGISGRIAVTKHGFLNAGGYDEKYETWSPDDKDFNVRMRNLGYMAHQIDNKYLLGVLHNDKMRFREYPHIQNEECSEDFEQVNYCKTTISNFGNFGCGIVYRNDNPPAVELKSLPTRIFGIGMHKTGTTSLHEAFKILGYESAHWWSAHWARAIWTEMKTDGRSPTLEKHYAVCDLPITLLYKDLDKAYPGSKFVLTTRSEAKWLASVKAHWDRNTNVFREAWDHDPFSHRVHRELYGTKNPTDDVFIERFRRHNTEVQEYFKDRPRDLLVMDIDQKPGWKPLCEFLDVPVPGMPYPVVYKTQAS
jgi:hypothetical protein